MNPSQIHLALTHIPVVLSLTGLVMLAVSMISKNNTALRISLYIFLAAGLFTLPVFFTGEGAEEVVEEIPGVAGSMIEKHEDIAKYTLWTILITAFVSLAGLVKLNGRSFFNSLKYPLLVLAIVSAGLMTATAHFGGQIRHTELNNNIAAGAMDNGENNKEDHNDDD
jgi:biotin transporter BioY